MKFRLQNREGHDVMGGELDAVNVYLTAYVRYHDRRHTDLGIGEVAPCTISLSGGRGQYFVVRVS
jgi:uncharacterized protein (DUF779 family)